MAHLRPKQTTRRAFALRDIVSAQAEAGDFQNAMKTAMNIGEIDNRRLRRWWTSQNIWRCGKGIDIIRAMTQVAHNSAELPPDLNLAEEKLVGCVNRGVQCKIGKNGEFPKEEIKSGNAANMPYPHGRNQENPALGGVISLRHGFPEII